jgi:membrane protein DedA with SNARE-associated domain
MISALVIASITGQLTSWIGHHGAYAVFAIMALDALLPVGGELTMLYAGALAAGAIAGQHPILLGHHLSTGLESYVVLALAGTIGYLIGSLVGWGIGRWGGRWLRLSSETLDSAERWFDRHGRAAVFLGRLTPVVRSFISIPAGVFDTPLGPYAVLTLAGSAIWCFGFAGAGWALGTSYERVHHAFGYVDVIVVVAAVATLLALIAVHRRQRARA